MGLSFSLLYRRRCDEMRSFDFQVISTVDDHLSKGVCGALRFNDDSNYNLRLNLSHLSKKL